MKIILAIFLVLPVPVFAQVLIEDSKYADRLKNGEDVVLFSSRECTQCFYYLPLNLDLARKQDGTPEISLVTWKNDENSKIIGGILHFLVHWGMSNEDEGDIALRLRSRMDSSSVIMGPVSVQAGTGLQFRGSDDLASLLTTHLTTVPLVPTTPGSKMAFSFRFGEEAIGTLMQYVDNPSKTVTKLIVPYTYTIWNDDHGTSVSTIQLELCMKDLLKLIR